MDKNDNFDLLAVVSVLLGMQNLQENRQQSAHNDVQLANDKQAQYLLQEINRRFDEQNKMLERLIELLEDVK
jgi:hypothetical protein